MGWALDEVDYLCTVTNEIIPGDDGRIEGRTLNPAPEGVFIHGLYLEGASWNKTAKNLEEATSSKDTYVPFPKLQVSA